MTVDAASRQSPGEESNMTNRSVISRVDAPNRCVSSTEADMRASSGQEALR